MRSRITAILISAFIFISCLAGAYFYQQSCPQPEDTTEVTQESEATDTTDTAEKEEFYKTEILSFKDIPYGDESNQTFDLHLPVNDRKETGLVLFIHGGGWKAGTKSSAYKSYPVFHANKSYATATMNYRFISDGINTVDDILEDITLALERIKTFAAGYSVNITKVILGGHSAGGHLSLLYAYMYKDYAPIEPVGVFASAPVPDLTVDSFYTKNSLGDEKRMCNLISLLIGEKFTPKTRASKKTLLDRYSPVTYASADSAPTIILHGNKDGIAPFEGSEKLDEKLTEYNVEHELVVFENTGHGLKNPEKKAYASELMLRCAEEWFYSD